MSGRLTNFFGWAIAVPMLIVGITAISIIAALCLLVLSLLTRGVLASETPLVELFQDLALLSMAALMLFTNRRVSRLRRDMDQLLRNDVSPRP
jgi:hypothetical protein